MILCSKACLLKRQADVRRLRKASGPPCRADGCERTATRVGAGLCETCFYRYRRTGTFAPRPRVLRRGLKNGYILVWSPGHPLAMGHGMVYEHRKVMFDLLGSGDQECFWCGVRLAWADVVVDHLNEVKDDNDPSNLVVSCNGCNRSRGAMLPFIQGMKPDVFETFVATMREQCATCHNTKSATE